MVILCFDDVARCSINKWIPAMRTGAAEFALFGIAESRMPITRFDPVFSIKYLFLQGVLAWINLF